MNLAPRVRSALEAKLLSLADDELILGHRNSEWCGHGPILEEDIAFSNIALDELGHARLWYEALAELRGEAPETYPDRLVFQRDAADWRSLPFVELPKGDWAFSMMRQYLFDAFEKARCEALAECAFKPMRDAAAKIAREEIYHLRHTEAWTLRLALGTEESRIRMARALEELWPWTAQLFEPTEGEAALVAAGIAPDAAKLREAWRERVGALLKDCELTPPKGAMPLAFDRIRFGPHRSALLQEMQEVARVEPEAKW